MNFGEVLRKTRNQKNLTQESLGAKLFCEASTISKIENDYQEVKASTVIEWLVVTQRLDILALLINGMSLDDVLKLAFTEEYLKNLSQTEIPDITLEQVKERFENPDKVLAYFNKNQEGN